MTRRLTKRWLPVPQPPAPTANVHGQYEDHRGALVRLFLLTLSLVALVFGSLNLLVFGLYWLGGIELGFFLVAVAALMDQRLHRRHVRTAWITTTLFGLLSLIFFWLVEGAYNGAVWLLWFPMIAFFLLGTRRGLVAYAVYGAAVTVLIIANQAQWPAVAGSESLTNIVGSLLAFGVVTYFHEQTKERAYRQVSELACRDPLTGVANRRSFVDAIARLEEWGSGCSLLVMDIDHFKAVNDAYGHATGDCALREVATRLEAAVRKQDLVGRLGGEEFGVLLVECDHAEARSRADEIKRRVADQPVAVLDQPVFVTVSIGVASSESGVVDFERLFAQADARLYKAKARGRNLVIADDPT